MVADENRLNCTPQIADAGQLNYDVELRYVKRKNQL